RLSRTAPSWGLAPSVTPVRRLPVGPRLCRPRLLGFWPPGEVSEWLKEHAWKACVRKTYRGFESPPLRQGNVIKVGSGGLPPASGRRCLLPRVALWWSARTRGNKVRLEPTSVLRA